MSTPRTASAENVIAGWLGMPIPYVKDPKPRKRPHQKNSAQRIAERRRLREAVHEASRPATLSR